MTDPKNDLHNMATQYMEMWQKQMKSQATERAVEDAMKTSDALNQQMGEMMKGFDSPEKIQNWMTTWAETWKAQIENATGQQPNNPFWPPAAAAASHNPDNNVAELEKRIATLEERVRILESQLKS
ncbi:hypothetical protein RYZ26_08665 [Terasakiella sp. A23]|uniref:hypothetical protein n=1 Tax=Terasakiella sp. FCG-A23 TaxID=3080561 RepID=UPI00295356E0|nr:hypothetical protein [Terasakiella sp. A23]MDV7339662.1 hypothetical protein [Terasakiella sp. A23]